jgi:hypothetical protein
MLTSAFTLRLGAAALLFAAAPAVANGVDRAPADSASTEAGGAVVDAQVAPAAKKEKKAEERKLCRFDGATGSNLRGKKICLTAKQWRARQD